MITSFFITVTSSALSLLVLVLPVSSIPSWITDAIVSVSYYVNQMTYILPISTMFTVLAFVIAYEGIMWGWQAGLWIFKKLPFIGK